MRRATKMDRGLQDMHVHKIRSTQFNTKTYLYQGTWAAPNDTVTNQMKLILMITIQRRISTSGQIIWKRKFTDMGGKKYKTRNLDLNIPRELQEEKFNTVRSRRN